MARIITAIDGCPEILEGFPIVVSERMAIIEPVFAFLDELAETPGRSHAPKTILTYAEHLVDYFDALEQSEIDWVAASEREIAAYRNRMLSQPSPHTGRPYARSTINDRVRTVCRFYEYAAKQGWMETVPFHFVDVRAAPTRHQSFLAHVDSRSRITAANILTVSEYETLPRPIPAEQLRKVFSKLKMPYHLMGRWALATGMRRKELCGLAIYQIPETAHLDTEDHPLIPISLKITKGDKHRPVYPPLRLLDQTHHYIVDERHAVVCKSRCQAKQYPEPPELFLNRLGKAVVVTRMTSVFAEAFKAAGVEGSLHWLRHTFAIAMLTNLQKQAARNPHLNPLKVLQVLLGHSSIQTTAIYLRCVEVNEAEVASSLDYYYGEIIPDAP